MIRKLQLSDIDNCVAIHQKNSMNWSHNAQIGADHLKNIYKVILTSDESFGVGFFNDEDRMVCFITATSDYFLTMEKMFKLVSSKHIGKIFKQVLRDPNELFDMMESRFVIPKVIKKMDIRPHLLTWHNNFNEKEHAIAPMLVMRRALRELKALGFGACTAQVDANNQRPNNYYRKTGARLRYSSRWNNVYEVQTI